MARMRIFLLAVVVAVLIIFTVQNWLPVLPLVFFGSQTTALPLAIWMVIFMAAGALTSVALQLINYVPSRIASGEEFSRPDPELPPRNPPENSLEKEEKVYTTGRSKSDWEKPQNPDWEAQPEDDWDIEEPPEEATRPRINFNLEKPARDYEVRRQPTTKEQSGSVYSYGYRQPEDTGVGKPEQVYDANYRLIRPPLRKEDTSPVEEKEEDWGLDED